LSGLWAFELAGVEFIDDNGDGPDVRLRKDRRNLGDHQYDAPPLNLLASADQPGIRFVMSART